MLQLNKILLARDFSSVSDQALRAALDLAQRTGAAVHLFYARVLHNDPFGGSSTSEAESPESEIQKRLRTLPEGTSLDEAYPELIVTTGVARDVAAAPAILNVAEEEDADLIVMGTHGRRGVSRLLMGSVAEEVVRHADRPVFTVRRPAKMPPENTDIQRILVPIDFSEHSREALRTAREMARLYDAHLDLLHVIEETLHPAFYVGGYSSIYEAQPDIREKVTERLQSFFDEADGAGADVTEHVKDGHAAREITQFAEQHGTDLIVMATHGLTGLEHFMLGSVAEKVIRRTPVPILTVKSYGRSLLADG